MVPRPYFNSHKEVLPLVELMKLERIDDWTFRSCSKAYAPTGGANGAYGGFVYSLAAWAAANTVEEGLILHVRTENSFLMHNKVTVCVECLWKLYPRRNTPGAL